MESQSSYLSSLNATEWATKIQENLLLITPGDGSSTPVSFLPIDEIVMEAPRRHSADPHRKALAKDIAQILFPSAEESLNSLIKYEKAIVQLRKAVIEQRKRAIEEATERKLHWSDKIRRQGPWDPSKDPVSLAGAPSLPMPVKIAEHDTLEPFFDHLRNGGTQVRDSTARGIAEAVEIHEPGYQTKALEFEKGVVYEDHRMDLCKMVLGPPNIGDLLESLKTNTFITHFLLGNNIIGPHGARVIADFMKEFPDRMDTWYLAGNCIDAPSFKLLVDQWTQSSSVTNIWLKRNPLGPSSAKDVFRLITGARNLRTLDLDQTELGDAGITELFQMLADYESEKPLALRHIYMNAVGVSVKACEAIAKYLASAHCGLDSLYMSNNPVGSAGIVALSEGLKANKSLTRLSLSSVGMGDEGAIALCAALKNHPELAMLDIGQNYATQDLGMRYNWITDSSAESIQSLIASSPKLQYLDLDHCALTHSGLNRILESVLTSHTLLHFVGLTIYAQSKDTASIHLSQEHARLEKLVNTHLAENVRRHYGPNMTYQKFTEEERRWLVNDKTDVRKIDSVYRNRDAGLARRGLKKLDKWWDEGDTTLDEVMKSVGAVGPVCTKRLNIVGPVCTKRKTVVA